MAFLEQLGKRLSDAGHGAAQQAKNFTDVTRLNSAISDKEKKITQLYAFIGQAYYQRHRSDPDAEELQQIEAVNALFAEIAQCQEEIKQIKGVSKCPSCGADVPLNSAFCSTCGAKVPQTAPAEAVPADSPLCPSCHAPVRAGSRFCICCGAKLESGEE